MKMKISKVKQINNILKLKYFNEMAKLQNNVTGIKDPNYVIYISKRQGSHGARVKVFKKPKVKDKDPCVSISIEKEPKIKAEHGLKLPTKVLVDVKYWVSINHVQLLKLWNSLGDLDYNDVIPKLDKVDK